MIETIKRQYEVVIALIILGAIILFNYDFNKALILLLELVVLIEVVKMITTFVEKQRIKLRAVIDGFIIFIIRDVIIAISHKEKDYDNILFLLFVIIVFFVFRIIAMKLSPKET